MRIFKFLYLLPVICLLLAAGCRKKKDIEEPGILKPVIKVIYTSTPAITEFLCESAYDNVLKLSTGQTLELRLHLKGSQTLSQYKIDIHNNFDCHQHGAKPTGMPWQLLKLVDLNTTDIVVTEKLTVPADAAAGNYHLMLQLLDEDGNEAEFVEFNVIVINAEDPDPPILLLTDPIADTLHVPSGSDVRFAATVTDNYSLKDGRVEIDFTDAAGETYSALKEIFPSTTLNSFSLDRTYTMPAFPAKGLAVFRIRAFDEVNNVAEKKVYIYIL